MKPLVKKEKSSSSTSEELSQRPKRNTCQKSIDVNNGLLWREETDLKKALYASLQETRKKNLDDDDDNEEEEEEEELEQEEKPSIVEDKSVNGQDESPKKAKVHAQRKFAQGSTPTSPTPTPLKIPNLNSTTELIPYRRPKTEDFLTFLCLRGTSILPSSLDFLNCCSKSDSSSECRSLSPEPDIKECSISVAKISESRDKNHTNAICNGIAKKNITCKTLAKRNADLPLSVVKKHTTKLQKEVSVIRKRKSREEVNFFQSRVSYGTTTSASGRTRSTSLYALREKYKKQRIAAGKKKFLSTRSSDVTEKSKTSTKTTYNSNNKNHANSIATRHQCKVIEATTNKLKSAKKEKKLALEKRKSLRSAHILKRESVKRRNKKSMWLRRAKLVPPIVDVDSDSEPEVINTLQEKKSVQKINKSESVKSSKKLHNLSNETKNKPSLTSRQILLRKHMQNRLKAKKSQLQTKHLKSKVITKKSVAKQAILRTVRKNIGTKKMSLRKDQQNKRVTRSAKQQIEEMLWANPEKRIRGQISKLAITQKSHKRLNLSDLHVSKKLKMDSSRIKSAAQKEIIDKVNKKKRVSEMNSRKNFKQKASPVDDLKCNKRIKQSNSAEEKLINDKSQMKSSAKFQAEEKSMTEISKFKKGSDTKLETTQIKNDSTKPKVEVPKVKYETLKSKIGCSNSKLETTKITTESIKLKNGGTNSNLVTVKLTSETLKSKNEATNSKQETSKFTSETTNIKNEKTVTDSSSLKSNTDDMDSKSKTENEKIIYKPSKIQNNANTHKIDSKSSNEIKHNQDKIVSKDTSKTISKVDKDFFNLSKVIKPKKINEVEENLPVPVKQINAHSSQNAERSQNEIKNLEYYVKQESSELASVDKINYFCKKGNLTENEWNNDLSTEFKELNVQNNLNYLKVNKTSDKDISNLMTLNVMEVNDTLYNHEPSISGLNKPSDSSENQLSSRNKEELGELKSHSGKNIVKKVAKKSVVKAEKTKNKNSQNQEFLTENMRNSNNSKASYNKNKIDIISRKNAFKVADKLVLKHDLKSSKKDSFDLKINDWDSESSSSSGKSDLPSKNVKDLVTEKIYKRSYLCNSNKELSSEIGEKKEVVLDKNSSQNATKSDFKEKSKNNYSNLDKSLKTNVECKNKNKLNYNKLISKQIISSDDDSERDIPLDEYLKINVSTNSISKDNKSKDNKNLKFTKKELEKNSHKESISFNKIPNKDSIKSKKEGLNKYKKDKDIKSKNQYKFVKREDKANKKDSEKTLAKLLKKEKDRLKSSKKEEKSKHKKDGSSSSKPSSKRESEKDGSRLKKDSEKIFNSSENKADFIEAKKEKLIRKLSRSNSYEETRSPKKKKKYNELKDIEKIKNLISNSSILNEISGFKAFKRRLSGDKSDLKKRLSKKKQKKLALLKEKKISKKLSSKLLRKYSKKKGLKSKKNKLKRKGLKKEMKVSNLTKVSSKSKKQKHKAKEHRKESLEKMKTVDSSQNSFTKMASNVSTDSSILEKKCLNLSTFMLSSKVKPSILSYNAQTSTSDAETNLNYIKTSDSSVHLKTFDSKFSPIKCVDLACGTDEKIVNVNYVKQSLHEEIISTDLNTFSPNDLALQIPYQIIPDTSTKTVADAATNTCEEDIDEVISSLPDYIKNFEMSVGTQTITPTSSPSPTFEAPLLSCSPIDSSLSTKNVSVDVCNISSSTKMSLSSTLPRHVSSTNSELSLSLFSASCINSNLSLKNLDPMLVIPSSSISVNELLSVKSSLSAKKQHTKNTKVIPTSLENHVKICYKEDNSTVILNKSIKTEANTLLNLNKKSCREASISNFNEINHKESNLSATISKKDYKEVKSKLNSNKFHKETYVSDCSAKISHKVIKVPTVDKTHHKKVDTTSNFLKHSHKVTSAIVNYKTPNKEVNITANYSKTPNIDEKTVSDIKTHNKEVNTASDYVTPNKEVNTVNDSKTPPKETSATPKAVSQTSSKKNSSKSERPVTPKINKKISSMKNSNVTSISFLKSDSFPLTSAKMVSAPVYYPTSDEFQDPLEYISKISPEAEQYGICKIVPPDSFKPECKVNDDLRFMALNQYLHKMLYRWGPNVQHTACIKKHLKSQKVEEHAPLIGGIELDLSKFYHTVQQFGGLQQVIVKKLWQKVADVMRIPKAAQDRVTKLYDAYCKYLVSYDLLPPEEKQKLEEEVVAEHNKFVKLRNSRDSDKDDDVEEEENIECVTKGKSMPLSNFFRIARNTMSMWFKNDHPLPEEVENEFWKIVTERNQHIVVHAGNIDSNTSQSGFPANKTAFGKHPWNLKVLTNNNRSILRSMGPVTGITSPTLHVGMLFTTSCWYRDPHSLPWIEYLHTGASKIWYGIPAIGSEKFKNAVEKIVPECCTNKPLWLSSESSMIPPELLVKHGSSLSRTIQKSGQFIVIFPESFTSTISCGYSVSESVYFAPSHWLNLAEKAFQDIQNSCESPAFSLDRLLFSIASDPKPHLKVLPKILSMIEKIISKETKLRAQLNDYGLKECQKLSLIVEPKEKRKKSKNHIDENEPECDICSMPCYLSRVIYPQEDSVYCLSHALDSIQRKNLKSCKLLCIYDEKDFKDILEELNEQMTSLSHNSKKTKKKLPT